jgi:hypothetical protein
MAGAGPKGSPGANFRGFGCTSSPGHPLCNGFETASSYFDKVTINLSRIFLD